MTTNRLPVPASFKVLEDNQDSNEFVIPGRIRSYPHVRGQWTTFPYVSLEPDLIQDLLTYLTAFSIVNLFDLEEIHLSLVRGHYALRHHQIQLFVAELSRKLAQIDAFSMCLSTVKLFENDEKTRCFICLCEYTANLSSHFYLSSQKVIKYIEDTLNLFGAKVKTPKTRDNDEDFIFHTSIGWCLPAHKEEAIELVDRLNDVLNEPIMVRVGSVKVKIGNQLHTIALKKV